MPITRKPYTTDVSDEEWAFVVPYLTLLSEDASQRRYDLREVYNGLRYIVKTGSHWRNMPHDLPPWPVVYQQTRRWVVERDFAWVARFHRLACDYERLATTLAGYHFLAFSCLMLSHFIHQERHRMPCAFRPGKHAPPPAGGASVCIDITLQLCQAACMKQTVLVKLAPTPDQ